MTMISIIVPVYNTSRYLKNCLDSILNQSFKDFELIIVNDGSTDNSKQICKAYAKKDKRIIIIDKDNQGVDKSRFEGLNASSGEYITFVDSDDWLEEDSLKVMYENMTKYNVDYVQVGSQRVLDKFGIIKRKSISRVLGFVEQPRLFEDYFISFFGYNILSVTMWGKLYKRDSILNANLRPSGLKMGEDLFFNMHLFPFLKSIFIDNYIGYNYRFGGMTSRYNPYLYPNLKLLYHEKKDLIKQYNYIKAIPFIQYELVNVLKSDIIQKIRYKTGSKKTIIDEITLEISDSSWNDLKNCPDKDYLERPLPKAIIDKDSFSIYNICLQQVNEERLKRKCLHILSYLLGII